MSFSADCDSEYKKLNVIFQETWNVISKTGESGIQVTFHTFSRGKRALN